MSDGLTEARRGTYFLDRSKLPKEYITKEPKKLKWWQKLIKKIF